MSSAKLIRDKIPALLQSEDPRHLWKVTSVTEYHQFLQSKLIEECEEYISSLDINELADILEVVLALASAHDISREELESVRATKRRELGGFDEGWVIEVAAD